jgi:hypothetical protein
VKEADWRISRIALLMGLIAGAAWLLAYSCNRREWILGGTK